MSIIYEALKKVQGKSDTVSARPGAQASVKEAKISIRKPTVARVVILILVLLALGLILTETLINRWFAARAKEEKTLPVAAPYILPAPPPLPSLSPAPARPDPQEPITSVQPSVAEPLPELALNGIVLSEDGNIALINDQILKVGDTIEGARVEEMSGNQVILSYKARKITLKAK